MPANRRWSRRAINVSTATHCQYVSPKIMSLVTRIELEQLLSDWRAGTLSAAVVHDWAAERYAVSSFEPEDAGTNEGFSELDILDRNLLAAEDAPALQKWLAGSLNTPDGARAAYQEYIARIDFGRRRERLAGESLYARFWSRLANKVDRVRPRETGEPRRPARTGRRGVKGNDQPA